MPPLHDEIFHKALSSDVRREILLSLSKKEKYLSELSEEIKKKPQTVDFHVNVLQEIGLIEGEWREGKKYYALKDKKILEFIQEGKTVPPHLRHKPPHEIVADSMKELTKRMERIEKKIDALSKK
ncbi:winged helix-turn-helix transcriptional regulator [Candidatus Woesearchaeota archaeon]|nr:winged helix-turn-helix transcriptional regulator [Candidatus Woesearchaeota archaeon]